jgi:hypothetical protein
VHRRDDLLDVDPLQVDARGNELGMAELALDDVHLPRRSIYQAGPFPPQSAVT